MHMVARDAPIIVLLAPALSAALPPASFLYQLQNIDVAQVAAES